MKPYKEYAAIAAEMMSAIDAPGTMHRTKKAKNQRKSGSMRMGAFKSLVGAK